MRAARWFNWVSFWGMALVFVTGCGDEASTPPPSDVSEQDGLDAELELDQVPDLPELSEQSDGEQDDEPDCVSRCEQAVAFNCVEQTLLSTECAVGCVLLDNHAWCSCELDGDCPEEHACALGELGGTCRPLLCTPNAARCEPVDGQGFDAVRCDEQGLSELRERCDGGCVDGVCICLDDSHCLAAQHCDDTGACVEDLCVAQTPFCAGSELRLCDERGVASSLLQECGSAGCLFDACGCETDADCLAAQHCSSEGQPLCVADVCEAGARFCDGDAIMLCSPSGSHAELLQSCARACVAEGDSAYCHCSQASDCLGEAFCDAQGHCIAQVCDPDLLVCDGNVAVSCLPDGSAERRVDCGAQTCLQGVCQCTDDTHCAAAEYCSEGQCLPDVCAQGEEFCAGRERRACAANGSGDSVLENCRIGCVLESGQSACRCNSISDCELEQYCKSPGLGGFDNCSPDICLAGATSCDGQVAVSCSFDGGQETRVDCLAMSCEEGQCRCDADGQCPAEQYCAASRSCTDDVCVASTTFCMGDSVMLCNERGSGSSEAQPCAPGHCAAGACTCSDALECLGAESCMGGACVCESGLRCGPSSTCCSSAEVCEDEQCKLACSGQRCGVSEELCCTGNDECLWNQCIATWGACTVNDDCELDEFCELSSRRCVKAADDPNQCIYIPPVGVFTPEEQW
ncbi:MAG: hypothetical protein RBU37_01205, partial [Myxococcota bacterium]|nr:hypothetical protein [Myxococcota bacterium]